MKLSPALSSAVMNFSPHLVRVGALLRILGRLKAFTADARSFMKGDPHATLCPRCSSAVGVHPAVIVTHGRGEECPAEVRIGLCDTCGVIVEIDPVTGGCPSGGVNHFVSRQRLKPRWRPAARRKERGA